MEYTMSPPPATEMSVTSTISYAGFWRRFVAAIIDGLLIGAVFSVFQAMVGVGFWSGSRMHDADALAAAMAALGILVPLQVIASWLYYALMESSKNQGTLGKMALGLRVTDLDGKRISFGRASGRYFAKFLSAIVLFIGYIMAAFTPKKQAMHDMIASTLVLSKQATVPAQVAQNAYSVQG
jgi:uncharacterized RDD family membrane protein YckC